MLLKMVSRWRMWLKSWEKSCRAYARLGLSEQTQEFGDGNVEALWL